jgi:hypothetical protein
MFGHVRNYWLALPLLLLGAACASQRASDVTVTESAATPSKTEVASGDAAKEGDEDEMICVKEEIVGSNIPKRHCRTRGQIERERREAQEEMRRVQRQNPTKN